MIAVDPLRDEIAAALRSVELPAEVRARIPYGALAHAVHAALHFSGRLLPDGVTEEQEPELVREGRTLNIGKRRVWRGPIEPLTGDDIRRYLD